MAASGSRNLWLIPAALLVAAILLLMLLQHLVGGPDLPDPGGPEPEEAALEAVRSAPADPFRYGGRTVGEVLRQVEPRTGWTDSGWSVRAGAEGRYRVERVYNRAEGGERVYAFTVAADLDQVWPANGHARALMHRGPRSGS